MRRRWIFIMGAVLLVAMGMGVGTIAAQENATNETDEVYPGDQGPNSPDDRDRDADQDQPANENETVAETEDDYLREIDSGTRITNWSYAPGMFTITIEADQDTKVSMTEAGDFEEGTGSFNYQEVELTEGSNTVTMPVTDRPGAGVAIATRRSLSQGSGVFVSVGQLERNPFRHFGGESGLFSGVALSVSLAAIGAAYVVRSENSGVIEA
ncbi:hypothetical protein [Halosolutus halophilus]|uniref:hypothetical protein n=1 Tax=Halosolutus halophilus TaxID=1552990 RepID=UPI002235253F|nr:hypothetical protein [Halosolutus halophilus]